MNVSVAFVEFCENSVPQPVRSVGPLSPLTGTRSVSTPYSRANPSVFNVFRAILMSHDYICPARNAKDNTVAVDSWELAPIAR